MRAERGIWPAMRVVLRLVLRSFREAGSFNARPQAVACYGVWKGGSCQRRMVCRGVAWSAKADFAGRPVLAL